MDDRQQLRMRGLKLYNIASRTAKYRKYRQRMWGTQTLNVLAVLDSDFVHEVEARADTLGILNAVHVVVYYPDTDTIRAARLLTPTDEDRLTEDPLQTHSESTVGMLMDLIARERTVLTTKASELTPV